MRHIFKCDVYRSLGNGHLELLREMRGTDTDSGIVVKEETGELWGGWTRVTEPKGTALKTSKERGTGRRNSGGIRGRRRRRRGSEGGQGIGRSNREASSHLFPKSTSCWLCPIWFLSFSTHDMRKFKVALCVTRNFPVFPNVFISHSKNFIYFHGFYLKI